jgi:hypothetical protein
MMAKVGLGGKAVSYLIPWTKKYKKKNVLLNHAWMHKKKN